MPPEPLTQTESQDLINKISDEIKRLNASLKTDGAINTTINYLLEKKDLLQQKLNVLLKQGRLLTEEDFNSVSMMLKNKQADLTSTFQKGVNNRNLLLAGGVVIVIGLILYYKNRKR